MPPKPPKTKETKFSVNQVLYGSCNLPLWDDALITQENWGAAANGNAAANVGTKSKNAKDPLIASRFSDVEGNAILERFIVSNYRSEAIIGEENNKIKDGTNVKVTWQNPEEIMKPFRPIIHRNTTPFLEPYGTVVGEGKEPVKQHPLRSKEDALKATEAVSQQKSVANNSKKGAAKDAAMPELSIFELHPEIVSFTDELVSQDAESWQNVSNEEIVARYRQLPALMEPYDPSLTSGCAATPAEACGSRYSTALRQKLQRAEALSTLTAIPPFLMSSYNSVLLAIESAQAMIPKGDYLWELIYPQAPGTRHPIYNPAGKYVVKLFVQGAWRRVTVDDTVPVDELGRPLLTVTSLKELWPVILAKALLKSLKEEASFAFFEAPEVLLPCFMGNWLTFYHDFSVKETVNVASLLLRYVSVLSREEKNKNEKTLCLETGNAAGAPTVPGNATGGNAAAESSSSIGKKGELLCEQPFLICATRGCRDKNMSSKFGFGNGVQLFSVVNITPLRNTLALQIVTTPKVDIEEDFFSQEKHSMDVAAILEKFSQGKSDVPNEKDKSLSSLWLTMEEFSAHMDSLVVFRPAEDVYHNYALIEADNVLSSLSEVALPATAKKPAPPASSSTQNGVSNVENHCLTAVNKTVWLTASCEKECEEVVLVISSPIGTAAVTVDDQNGVSGSPKSVAAKNENENALVKSRPTSTGGAAQSASKGPVLVANEVFIDHFQWDRAEPISRAVSLTYEQGKRKSILFNLGKGNHTFRVSVPRMSPKDRLIFLSNASLDVKSEPVDPVLLQGAHDIVDADTFASFSPSEGEQVIFKRKIKLSDTTRFTILLNAFPADVDPVTLRNVPSTLTSIKAKTAASNVSNLKSRKSSMDSPTFAHADITKSGEEFDERIVLSHIRLTLINLETQQRVACGKLGRITQIEQTANEKGFLLIATFGQSEEQRVPQVASPKRSKAVVPKGVWKLTIKSNNQLSAFENIPVDATVIRDTGKLWRGGTNVLFSRGLHIVEPAHMTLSCHINAGMPFAVTISRANGSYNALAPLNGRESYAEQNEGAEIVFQSDFIQSELFIENLFLESGDKGKGCIYIIEGTVPRDRSVDWDESIRKKLEQNFQVQRSNTERQMMDKRLSELEEYENGPQDFITKKKEEAAFQQQAATTQTAPDPRSTKDVSSTTPGKKRRSSQDKRKPTSSANSRRRSSDTAVDSPRFSTAANFSGNSEDIQYNFVLLASIPKIENKSILVIEDGLNSLRQQWKPFMTYLSEKKASVPSPTKAATTLTSNTSAKLSKTQQAAVAAEELQRQEQGRLSRQRYLSNPSNILLPYVEAVAEEEKVNEKPRTSNRRHTSTALQTFTVVTRDPEEGEQRHEAPIPPAEYVLQMLPLQEIEVVEPVLSTSPLKPTSSSGNKDKKSKSRSASNHASSPTSLSTTAAACEELRQADERATTVAFQQNVKKVTESILENAPALFTDLQKSNAPLLNKYLHNFWESKSEVTPEEPLTYSSLVGYAGGEENHNKRQKSVSYS